MPYFPFYWYNPWDGNTGVLEGGGGGYGWKNNSDASNEEVLVGDVVEGSLGGVAGGVVEGLVGSNDGIQGLKEMKESDNPTSIKTSSDVKDTESVMIDEAMSTSVSTTPTTSLLTPAITATAITTTTTIITAAMSTVTTITSPPLSPPPPPLIVPVTTKSTRPTTIINPAYVRKLQRRIRTLEDVVRSYDDEMDLGNVDIENPYSHTLLTTSSSSSSSSSSSVPPSSLPPPSPSSSSSNIDDNNNNNDINNLPRPNTTLPPEGESTHPTHSKGESIRPTLSESWSTRPTLRQKQLLHHIHQREQWEATTRKHHLNFESRYAKALTDLDITESIVKVVKRENDDLRQQAKDYRYHTEELTSLRKQLIQFTAMNSKWEELKNEKEVLWKHYQRQYRDRRKFKVALYENLYHQILSLYLINILPTHPTPLHPLPPLNPILYYSLHLTTHFFLFLRIFGKI